MIVFIFVGLSSIDFSAAVVHLQSQYVT